MPTWPTWLQPLYRGFRARDISPRTSFRSQVGPRVDRSLTYSTLQEQQWSVILVGKQYDDFLEFYRTTTRQGTLLARGIDPLTQEMATMRIQRLGRFAVLCRGSKGLVHRVSLTVEVTT